MWLSIVDSRLSNIVEGQSTIHNGQLDYSLRLPSFQRRGSWGGWATSPVLQPHPAGGFLFVSWHFLSFPQNLLGVLGAMAVQS